MSTSRRILLQDFDSYISSYLYLQWCVNVLFQMVARIPPFPPVEPPFLDSADIPPSLLMAGATAFSPDSKHLCIMRSIPGVFMLFNTVTRSMVTPDQFKPRYNAYKDLGIFRVRTSITEIVLITMETLHCRAIRCCNGTQLRHFIILLCQMVNTSLHQGEIGEVQWLAAPPSEQCELPADSPFRDFLIDQSVPIQVLLHKSGKGIGSTKFQIIERNNAPEPESEDDTSHRSPKKRFHSETSNADNDPSQFQINPKTNPCKALTQLFPGDVLRAVLSEDAVKPRLLVFSQPRRIPSIEPLEIYQRRKFAKKV